MRRRFATIVALVGLAATPVDAQMAAHFCGANGGAVCIGVSTTTCDAAAEGAMRWNTTDDVMEVCDGTSWRPLVAASSGGTPPTPPASAGYFVLTNGTWNGNLRARFGATIPAPMPARCAHPAAIGMPRSQAAIMATRTPRTLSASFWPR